MKKIGVLAFLLLLTSAIGVAQKYAFVDSEYIRKNIPAFTAAQEKDSQKELFNRAVDLYKAASYEEALKLFSSLASDQNFSLNTSAKIFQGKILIQ